MLLTATLFSQNIWGGNSVSTSDNLDAFSLNPAGFGVDRGMQSGYYIPVNNNGFSLFSASRCQNFGYLLEKNDFSDDETEVRKLEDQIKKRYRQRNSYRQL